MADAPAAQNPYDVVPYTSHPFLQSHPDRLATMATLFGMKPQPIEKCRVLELGCSSGGNLIPMADEFPESEFVGIDLSLRQVNDGRAVIEAVGLKNIVLHQMSITDVNEEMGQFDYIITHGVFSWVPRVVQDKILEICSKNLKPQGVAYVSYNTYPGWHMRGMIRDMMGYRSRSFDQPADRVRQARALLDFLVQSVPTEDNAYGIMLKAELNMLRGQEDSYLLHEHLEDVNEPVYFHQFMERAEAKQLQYLGECDFRIMATSNLSRQVESTIQSVATNLIEAEQYMDFVRNRMFRQTLLCHKDVVLDRNITPENILGLYVASPSKPENPEVDLRANDQTKFVGPTSVMTTSERLVKAAMLHLGAVWPRSVPFMDLLARARSRLNPDPVVVDAVNAARDSRTLAEPMIRCYSTLHVELSAHASGFTLEPSDKPKASALARYQAKNSNRVTNRRHENVGLNDLQRHIVSALDGETDRAGIIEKLVELVKTNVLVIHNDGQRVQDEAIMRDIMTKALEQNLKDLAPHAILIG